MKIILNEVHKFKFDPATLDAVIKSPNNSYEDMSPDICFMCELSRKLPLMESGDIEEIVVKSGDGGITLILKVVYPSPTVTPSYFLSINGAGGNIPIKRENVIALQRVVNRLYFEYSH